MFSFTVLLIQKRWKTARDAYVRDRAKLRKMKSGDSAKHIKKTDTSFDADEAGQENLNNEVVDLSESDADVDVEGSVKESQLRQNFIRTKRKKIDPLNNKPIAFLEEATKSDQDDHKAFLTSLLPTLKTFNEAQTLQFRSEVLRIIMEIKNIEQHSVVTHQAQSVSTQNVSSQKQQFNVDNSNNWSSRPSTSYSYHSSDQASLHSSDSMAIFLPSPSCSDTNYRPTLLELSATRLDDQTH
ncbi:unnamed protein product [Acanthoscelides obtectus]|uniref:BESS domain-containing protein n=1 Tax=Acanthoscelides obtectus TaxID=200917 RepID=A0A9P0JKV7_ACAOB|nr:unnamed protein product [Acanthoscelides obtectus]CAK1655006.1 hypothetical protein AOBTE_LOCUS18958 [Acanthoscelides obtectus]